MRFIMQAFGKPYGVCFVANFVQNFLFSILVTIIAPITTNKWHFDPFKNSLLFSAASAIMVLVIFVVAACSHISKNIDRIVILVSQLFMGASLISLAIIVTADKDLHFWELCIVVTLLVIGVPGQNTSITSIYSKFITLEYGTEKLGEYTGLLLQFGSIGSVLGPLWAGFALKYSTPILVSVAFFFLLLALFWTLMYYKTLVLPGNDLATTMEPEAFKHPMYIARKASVFGAHQVANQGVSSGVFPLAHYPAVEEEEGESINENAGNSRRWQNGVLQYENVLLTTKQ